MLSKSLQLSSMMSRVHKATPHEEKIKALLNTYSCLLSKPNATPPQKYSFLYFSLYRTQSIFFGIHRMVMSSRTTMLNYFREANRRAVSENEHAHPLKSYTYTYSRRAAAPTCWVLFLRTMWWYNNKSFILLCWKCWK